MYRRGEPVVIIRPDMPPQDGRFWMELGDGERLAVVVWHGKTAEPLVLDYRYVRGGGNGELPDLPCWAR